MVVLRACIKIISKLLLDISNQYSRTSDKQKHVRKPESSEMLFTETLLNTHGKIPEHLRKHS